MENIEMFTKACKEYGLTDAETFQTVDLWDGENMHQVCICIHALGRKVFVLILHNCRKKSIQMSYNTEQVIVPKKKILIRIARICRQSPNCLQSTEVSRKTFGLNRFL
jgi:hypothetical protein